jgi:neutral amino acid transport system substrate-binding protein
MGSGREGVSSSEILHLLPAITTLGSLGATQAALGEAVAGSTCGLESLGLQALMKPQGVHVLLLSLAGCGGSNTPTTGIPVGVLLPFSGQLGSSGYNIERALILATERVNAAGGISGAPIRLVEKDSRSDADKGFRAAQELLVDDGVKIVLGPEEQELTTAMLPLVKQADAVEMLPGLTSPTLGGVDALLGYWFRLGPTAASIGIALADRVSSDGVQSALVLSAPDDYSVALGAAFNNRFITDGHMALPALSFSANQTTFDSSLATIESYHPQTAVLVAFPASGASVIQDWASLKGTTASYNWYFSPTLDSEAFLDNIPPDSVDGMFGITRALSADSAPFASAFDARWPGDAPTTTADAYYDALAVAALALQAATIEGGPSPSQDLVRKHIHLVSSAPGIEIHWDQLSTGLDLIRQGMDVDYQGLSGKIDFDANGNALVDASSTVFWTVTAGKIVQ